MLGILIAMFGVVVGAVGQFALRFFPEPDRIWVTEPNKPNGGYYRDQAIFDQWGRAQKWGNTLTFIGVVLVMIGLLPNSGFLWSGSNRCFII